jgi:hypothetical protein
MYSGCEISMLTAAKGVGVVWAPNVGLVPVLTNSLFSEYDQVSERHARLLASSLLYATRYVDLKRLTIHFPP